MLTILFVDDEILTIKMLNKIIDWTSLGIEVIDYAFNGIDAFEKYKLYRPDIVLTDIKMPLCDGLELTKKICTINPKQHIIVMSGYSDFNYARNTMKYGVKDYLLKPLDTAELRASIERNADSIRSEYEKEKKLLKRYNNNIDKYMRDLIDIKDVVKSLDFLELNMSDYYLINLQIPLHPDNTKIKISDTALSNIENDIISLGKRHGNICLFDYVKNEWFLIVSNATKAGIIYFLKNIENLFNSKYSVQLFISFSNHGNRINQLGLIFCNLDNFKKYNHFFKNEGILELPTTSFQPKINRLDFEVKILEMITNGDAISSCKLFDDLLKRLQDSNYEELTTIYVICFEIIVQIRAKVASLSYCNSGLLSLLDINYNKLLTYNDKELLRRIMCQILSEACLLFESDFKKKYSKAVTKSIQYLKINYEHEITLDELSLSISISKNYLSSLFKKEVGMTLWEYLTDIRMKKAKYLMDTTMLNVTEIANKLGYDNANYFSKVFKKAHGESPSSYINEKS